MTETLKTLRPPLGLPKGSIRALLALSIFGSLMGALILNRKLPETTFWYLWMVNYAILGYYFASRQSSGGPSPLPSTAQPLYLPRGTVRWILLLSFFGTCGYFGYKWFNTNESVWEDRAFFPMLSLAGFFLGRLLNIFFKRNENSSSKLLQAIQEFKAILVVIAGVIIVLTIPLQFELPSHTQLQRSALLFVFFYFGSRS